jgi:hypothetical protein
VLVVRIIGLATAIALGVSVLLWVVTGNRKWLRLAWLIFKYALFLVLLILLLFFAERLLAPL